MGRSSIGKWMILVALVGAYVAASRRLVDTLESGPGSNFTLPILLGLMPMAALLTASAAALASRYRYKLARRDRPDFVAAFVRCGLPVLAIAATAHLLAPELLFGQLVRMWPPIERFLDSAGLKLNFETRIGVYGIAPAIYGVYVSGPPILLTLVLAAFTSRHRIVATPRHEASS